MTMTIRRRLRYLAIIICSVLCVMGSTRCFFIAAASGPTMMSHLVFGVLLAGLGFSVFRQYRWALRLTAAICLVIAVFLPIGILNPFTAGDDMLADKNPSTVFNTLAWVIPLDALLLAIAYFIDPQK